MPPPAFKTPITDFFAAGYSHQSFGKCMKFEDHYLQCLEAYGQRLSDIKCQDFKDDLYECNTSTKQLRRVELMQKERKRQIKNGERPPGKEYMEPPELHAYGGTFFGMNH